tara:strand:- start:1480 stop:2547 length:1068 start_codon:yes stop_codon:yes gene_type:complete
LTIFGQINLKDVSKYAIIFSLVIYFTKSNAWKDNYYDALTNVAIEMGDILVGSIGYGIELEDKDGVKYKLPRKYSCNPQSDKLGPKNIIYTNKDKKNMMWDMFDCRLTTIWNGGGEMKILNILNANAITMLLSFILGYLIILALLIVTLILIFKVVFIVLSMAISLHILIFISPLIIPFVLIPNQKVKSYFDNWLKKLIGYSIAPIIIYMGVFIFFIALDYLMYGTKVDVENNAVFKKETEAGTNILTGKIYDQCDRTFLICILHKFNDAGSGNILDTAIIPQLIGAALKLVVTIMIMIMIIGPLIINITKKIFGVEASAGPDIDLGGKAKKVLGVTNMAGGSAVSIIKKPFKKK